MKELFESLNQVYVNLSQGNMLAVNLILAFVMFGVALGVKMHTFKDVFRNPKSLIAGLMLQWVGLPLVTMILVILLNPIITPEMAFGMILVACCPGGNVSNFISSLSKGNIELSVSMTAVTTAFAPFVTPFNFWLWGTVYRNYAEAKYSNMPELEIPFGDTLMQILLILGIPIMLGFFVSRFMPRVADKLKKPTSIMSIVLFIGMVAVTLRQVLAGLDASGQLASAGIGILAVLAIVIVHNGSVLGTGYLTAYMLKTPVADRRSLTIETGIQNSGLGLAMLLNINIFNTWIWGARDKFGNIILKVKDTDTIVTRDSMGNIVDNSGNIVEQASDIVPNAENVFVSANQVAEGASQVVEYVPAGVCGGLILIAALWGVWHIVSGLSVATIFRRTKI
jgi:BASS family bile acid:Na+ symporter